MSVHEKGPPGRRIQEKGPPGRRIQEKGPPGRRIRVSAPASTANIGPGFDCLGAALSTRLHLEVEAPEPWPEGGRREPTQLWQRAVGLVCDLPNLASEMTVGFPPGRGFGFSAAEIACGLLIGCALTGRDPVPAELLGLGVELEGHPDNLAPALYGGLTLTTPAGDGWDVQRFVPTPEIRPCLAYPPEGLPTAEARKVLPEQVPLADAVRNIAATAGLVAVLGGGQEPTRERLLACTQDRLHQPYRAPLMPETAELVEALRAAGLAAAVSGAGPSVVTLVVRGDVGTFREVVGRLEGWRALELDWDLQGAEVL